MVIDVEKRDEIIEYWREGAGEALENAEYLMEKKSFSYALFFAHLATEKILKSLVIKKTNDHAPRTHDLLYLVGLSGVDLSKSQENLLLEIGKFNIEGRYPEEKQEASKKINQAMVENYLIKIKELYLWLSSEQKEK